MYNGNPIKKFDMNQIKDDKVVVLIGKRETGKSFLCKDLLHQHKDIPCGQVISATEAANGYYGKMVPPIFIHDEYKPEIIANVLKRQRMMIDKINANVTVDPRLFLLLDDCIYDQSWVKDVVVRSLFMNGRHFKILFIITMQYALGIPPNLRTNVDYVFILRLKILLIIENVYMTTMRVCFLHLKCSVKLWINVQKTMNV